MKLIIKGQIPSGKNAMQINPKTGHHYPLQRFKDWKLDAEWQLKLQLKKINFSETIGVPCIIVVNYYSGDKRRRDVPGMMDALCHILEHMSIIHDDCLLEDWVWVTQEVNKTQPGCEIEINLK